MKHLKSTLTNLHDLFDSSVPVRYIAEPFVSFDEDATSEKVQEYMTGRDYDRVGIRRDGCVVGYANRIDLKNGGRLGDYLIEFFQSHIVDENTPMIRALSKMRETGALFVRLIGQVGGIITRGDFQKIPVRMWLFGLISLVEMQMLRIIREQFPGDEWKKYLTSERLSLAEELFENLKHRNEAIDLLDCLQFCDKKEIIIKNDQLQKNLFPSKKKGREFLTKLESMRNKVAHSQDIISGNWPRTIELAEDAQEVLERLETWRLESDICNP